MATVLLTRSAADNERSAPAFERRGMRVVSAPMIDLKPIPKDACGLRGVQRLTHGMPVILTSSFATELWLDLRETDFHEHPPQCYYIVGQASAELLREGDPDIPVVAVAASAEELLAGDFAGVARVLYPCSTERRDVLVEGLRARGVEVIDLPLYYPAMPAGAREMLARVVPELKSPSAIAFFSPSAVTNFFAVAPPLPEGIIFAAIGSTTAEALHARGVADVLLAAEPSADALAEAVALHVTMGGSFPGNH